MTSQPERSQPPTQADRPIAISTPLGPDVLLLVSFKLREELGLPFSMDLRLQSEKSAIDFRSIIGQPVTVSLLQTSCKQTRFFSGIISEFSQVGFEQGDGYQLTNYRARMVPWLWLLSKATHDRVFENQSVLEIATQILSSYGLGEIKNMITTPYPKLAYCVQYNETDLDFLNRLFEFHGIYYYFDHPTTASNSSTPSGSSTVNPLVLCDVYTERPTPTNYGTLNYNPQVTSQASSEHVYEWSIDGRIEAASITLNNYDYTKPDVILESTASIGANSQLDSRYDLFQFPVDYNKSWKGEALAKIRAREMESRMDTRRACSNVLGVQIGSLFGLENYPVGDASTTYMATSMEMEITTAPFTSGPRAPAVYNAVCRFGAIPSTTAYAPPLRTPKPRMGGPQTATVVSRVKPDTVATPSDAVVDTDSYGNVLVRFHWGQPDSNDTTCWVRVAQNSAGSGWGSMFIPHIGTEVIVDFEDGDPDRPIVTGRLYNGRSMPNPSPATEPLASYFKDSSTTNLLRMDATQDSTSVLLQNDKNHLAMDSSSGSEYIELSDGKSWIHFNSAKGSLTTNVAQDHSSCVHGNVNSVVFGLNESTILGINTSTYVGLYNAFYFGGYVNFVNAIAWDNFFGLKLATMEAAVADIHFGWKYEKHKIRSLAGVTELGGDIGGGVATAAGAIARKCNELYTSARTAYRRITEETAIYESRQVLVEGQQQANYGSLQNLVDGDSDTEVAGDYQLSASNLNFASAYISLEGMMKASGPANIGDSFEVLE